MSTYWGYVCVSHDPPIESEHWHNHGEQRLVDALKARASYAAVPLDHDYGGDQLPPEGYWLRQHPHCRVLLRNEYGKEVDIAFRPAVSGENP